MTPSINANSREESSSPNQLQVAMPAQQVDSVFKPSKPFILAFASICIITLAAALDATSLSITLPVITERLDGTALEAFWSGTSFLVASAVVQPVFGGLSHVFGRKQVGLLTECCLKKRLPLSSSRLVGARGRFPFCHWLSHRCPSSQFRPHVGTLRSNTQAHADHCRLGGRTVQGLGGGGILALGEILITDLVPLSVRGSWLGFIGILSLYRPHRLSAHTSQVLYGPSGPC